MQNTSKRQIIEYAFVAFVILGSIAFLVIGPKSKGHVYDCSIAEISPDYPIAVKEACRELRAKNFQESLQKPK